MKTSGKLTLLKQIAEKLSIEPVSLVNATLRDYGITPSRSTKLTTFDYVVHKLRDQKVEALQEFAAQLGLSLPTVKTPHFWRADSLKLFISHVSSERDVAASIKNELEKYAISSFVAHEDIKPSREWHEEIATALHTCDALVAMLSPGFHKSLWTDHEVGFAYGRGLPIILVDMGVKPYGMVEYLQACSFTDVADFGRKVFQIFNEDGKVNQKYAYAILSQFEKSDTFAKSAENLRLVKRLKFWNSELLERLRQAPRRNNQIMGSFDVPEGVQALVKKVKAKLA